MTELLLGTRKGLFVLEGEPGREFEVRTRAFAGETVEFALRDDRSGRVLASVTSPFYGPKIWVSDDPGGDWQQASGLALPEGGDAALERIWVIARGEADGLCTPVATPACCTSRATAARRGSSTAGCGSIRRGRSGSRAPAASASTRSPPGRATRTGSRWRCPPRAYCSAAAATRLPPVLSVSAS